MKRAALLVALVVSACATTKPDAARQEVADILVERGGPADAITIEQDEESAAEVRERVDALLKEPLTVDNALRIALLNNRELRATFEELGVAQSELVQAGLLENPVIGGDIIISTRGNGLGGGLALSQSLLSAFLIPAKRRIAKAELKRSVLMVADASLGLVRDVRVAYAELQAAIELRELALTLTQTAEVAAELSALQFEAGNVLVLDRELFARDLDEARLELSEHDLEVTHAREELNRLLGLWGDQTGWTLADRLPTEANPPAKLGALESVAIRDRLDVSAARAEVDAMEYALQLRRRGIVPQIEAGVEAGNEVGDDEGHEWVVGPALSIELPIFDPGHADLARLRAQTRQAHHELEQKAIVARSEVREHRVELVLAARRVDYLRDTVLPRQEVVGSTALEQYNGMLLGAYELLELRAEKAEAYEEYIEARRDYSVAQAELERAVGGRLP